MLTLEQLHKPLPCLLCGRSPRYNAVFVPKGQARVGAPPGKLRLVRYSLCKKCRRKPGTLRRCESVILAGQAARDRIN